MISATLNGLPTLAAIAGLNASVIQMVQEIVNYLWFFAPATNKPLKSPVDFEGFPFGDSAA
jgi:hypothetical protein